MELFHVLNRGVDKRTIFLDHQDHMRFVHGLEVFNDKSPTENLLYFLSKSKNIDLRGRYDTPEKRDPLVQIHGWCLMRNHYHLLLSEIIDRGITKFLMKLNVGYAKYFNQKYKRVGTLFQGRTKKVQITTDAHFLHILHYIHLNPLDFAKGAADWRKLKIHSSKDAVLHLQKYRWSSYQDYCGMKNFPALLSTELFGDVFDDYKRTIAEYLKELEIEDIEDFILE